MCPLLTGTLNAKHNYPEVNKQASDDQVQEDIDERDGFGVEFLGKPVNAESKSQDGIIESWIIVVNICHTCHDNKWKIVENPANNRIQPGIMDMVNVGLAEVFIASLPADKVPKDQDTKHAQAGSAAPVNRRVSEEVVFNNAVVPGTHAKANLEYRPLPEFRRKIILFVWVRDKGVVRSHHGNIQVNKVLEKW